MVGDGEDAKRGKKFRRVASLLTTRRVSWIDHGHDVPLRARVRLESLCFVSQPHESLKYILG